METLGLWLAYSRIGPYHYRGCCDGVESSRNGRLSHYDLATDLPLWYGGAYVLGWAFRPVHVEMEALQLKGCVVRALYDQEVTILAEKKELEVFSETERQRKEVQLQVNLDHTMKTLAELAGNTLRLKPCEARA